MKIKKILSLVLAIALVASLAACSGSTKMTMGTGGATGTYYGYGGVLGQYIKNNAGIDVVVVSTDGSKANIQGIQVGDYSLGTVNKDRDIALVTNPYYFLDWIDYSENI